ncbi:MAG: SgcJ/EcaC family oxidoreductase [Rhizobacter sp.]|nr:SgcJ/EcaC family oxidoreductase [Bacteriovorax sp.]
MNLNANGTTDKNAQVMPVTAANPEAEIRTLIDNVMNAMRAADVEKLMSFYAPDVVAFDVMTPAQFVGKESYKKTWVDAFEGMSDATNAKQEISNLKITASPEVAFAHLIRHDSFTDKSGKKMEMYMRATHCFKKINGQWLITHEQYSLPIDFETNKAVFDAKPDASLH